MKPKQNYFLFDIDKTLINTDLDTEENAQLAGKIAKEAGLNSESSTRLFNDLVRKSEEIHGCVDIFWVAEKWADILGKDFLKEKLYRLLLRKRTDEILFPDTLEAVKKFSKKGEIGIFSEGHKEFQKAKLSAGGLINLFPKDRIFIFRSKLEWLAVLPYLEWLEVFPPGGRVYLFDDKREILESAKEKKPEVKTYLVDYSSGKTLSFWYNFLF